jgi:glycerol-3-phosphate dehydrogenase (NAD(P)+)
MTFQNIGIIGAGSWGTALAAVLDANRMPALIWGHDAEHIARVKATRENADYLPGYRLPDSLRFTTALEDLAGCDLVLLVTPSKAVREVAARLSTTALSKETVLLSCTKGVERGSGLRMSEILAECFPHNPVAVLSGPSHAEEVVQKMPTAIVIGSAHADIGKRLQQAFATSFFRPYTSEDVAGIELGGALKNIFAIAAGVSDGLGLGDNSKAALITRSLAELIRLGVALGGKPQTFQGLSGIGDLMVTCFSRHSRNRAVGERLGKGERPAEIVASMNMVAEGVPTTYSACECARRLGVETPIIDQMRALLDGALAPREALFNLLTREHKAE